MSADGEVEVSVRAEGVEDAAGEMGGDALAETADGGGGPPGGGGGGAGRFGQLLTRIATLLAFLGPILNVLGAVSNVMEAFVAPVAVMLLRLLQPLLVQMIRVLPVWFDIMDMVTQVNKNMSSFLKLFGLVGVLISVFMNADGKIGEVRDKAGSIVSGIRSLPRKIWSFMQQLPGQIASSVSGLLPGVGGGGGGGLLPGVGGGGGGGGLLSGITGDGGGDDGFSLDDLDGLLGGGGDRQRRRDQKPVVNLFGGLSALVDRVERDPNNDIF